MLQLNPSDLNITNTHIYIESKSFNGQLTWKCLRIKEQNIDIQMNFTLPKLISQKVDQDMVIVQINETVFGEEIIMKSEIKPQIEDAD